MNKTGERAGRQKLKTKRAAVKSCEDCVHKSICILYHGYGQIELRFNDTYVKDPDGFLNKLDDRLARRCRFYLDRKSHSKDKMPEDAL